MIIKLVNGDNTESKELFTPLDSDEELLMNFLASATREEFHPVVYEARLLEEELLF